MTRTEYLTARATWKREYKAASECVRAAKQARRVAQQEASAFRNAEGEYYYHKASDGYKKAHNASWDTMHGLGAARMIAKQLIVELEELKTAARLAWEEKNMQSA